MFTAVQVKEFLSIVGEDKKVRITYDDGLAITLNDKESVHVIGDSDESLTIIRTSGELYNTGVYPFDIMHTDVENIRALTTQLNYKEASDILGALCAKYGTDVVIAKEKLAGMSAAKRFDVTASDEKVNVSIMPYLECGGADRNSNKQIYHPDKVTTESNE